MAENVKVCRACLDTKGKLIIINDSGLSAITEDFFGSKVDASGLPPFLCSICVPLIYKFYLFRASCQESLRILDELRRTNKLSEDNIFEAKSTTIGLNLKRSPCVYVNIESEDARLSTDINNGLNPPIFAAVNPGALNNPLEIKKERLDDDNKNEENDILIRDKAIGLVTSTLLEAKRLLRTCKGGPRVKNEPELECVDSFEYECPEKGSTLRRCHKKKVKDDDTDSALRIKFTKHISTKYPELLEKFARKYKVDIKMLSKEEQKEEQQKERKEYYKKMPFICSMCFRGFYTQNEINSHMSAHDPAAGEHECDICYLRYKTTGLLKNHVMKTHKKRFTCKLCGTITKGQYHAMVHYGTHSGTTYNCKYCDRSFTVKKTYIDHMRRHVKQNQSNQARCPICGVKVIEGRGRKIHMRIHKEAVKCKSCDVLFENPTSLNRHLENAKDGVCPTGISVCVRCGEGFSFEEQLNLHLKQYHPSNEKKIQCDLCDKKFSLRCSLEKHMSVAHGAAAPIRNRTRNPNQGEKFKFVCEQCGKSYQYESTFIEHLRVHTGEKPFVCPHCGKGFRQNGGLQAHLRMHSNDKPFRCSMCAAAFHFAGHLQRHMRTHTQEKPYACDICDKRFSIAANMRQHVRSVHEGLPVRKKRDRVIKRDVPATMNESMKRGLLSPPRPNNMHETSLYIY